MIVKRSSQVLAFLAYALWIFGWLIVIIVGRKDRFALYHARQSFGLSIAVIAGSVAWLVAAWLVAWIPYVGAIVSAASFSLVIGLYLLALMAWVSGMKNAARARLKPIPFFGNWAGSLFRS